MQDAKTGRGSEKLVPTQDDAICHSRKRGIGLDGNPGKERWKRGRLEEAKTGNGRTGRDGRSIRHEPDARLRHGAKGPIYSIDDMCKASHKVQIDR